MKELLDKVCDSKDYENDYNTDVQDLLYKSDNGKYIVMKYDTNKYVCGTGINENFATKIIKKIK